MTEHNQKWLDFTSGKPIHPWLEDQLVRAEHKLAAHGDYPSWSATLKALQRFRTSSIDFDSPAIRIGRPEEIEDVQRDQLQQELLRLHPWRKGPFDIYGVYIDSEWRSDLKWQRLQQRIAPLSGRKVLDVGCGNGYYMLRMLGADAGWVLGIDPTILFNIQYRALTQLSDIPINARMLPIGIDELPDNLGYFDSVFSMGVLYHRRSPIDHLLKLFSLLRPGGELVLETLVIRGDDRAVLLPESRYAKMRNVWFIPSTDVLMNWLQRCGFIDMKLLDESRTTEKEQRATGWMKFESLHDFLDANDRDLTVEGYPSPTRAIISATRPA
jgi:tRNA (mo5U34)-methyltransferase